MRIGINAACVHALVCASLLVTDPRASFAADSNYLLQDFKDTTAALEASASRVTALASGPIADALKQREGLAAALGSSLAKGAGAEEVASAFHACSIDRACAQEVKAAISAFPAEQRIKVREKLGAATRDLEAANKLLGELRVAKEKGPPKCYTIGCSVNSEYDLWRYKSTDDYTGEGLEKGYGILKPPPLQFDKKE